MMQEVVFALSGFGGEVIVETEDGFFFKDQTEFLTEAERRLIEDAVRAGFYCRRLAAFVDAVRSEHLDCAGRADVDSKSIGDSARVASNDVISVAEAGHYKYGMAMQIEAILDAYRERIVELEGQLMSEPSLPLAHITTSVEDDRRSLFVLHRLVGKVRNEVLEGGPLLDLLWSTAASHMGLGSVGRSLWSLVCGVGQVLVNQLVAWLVYGRLVDPCGEFFIRRSQDKQPPWSPGSSWCGSPIDDFSKEVDATAAQQEWRGAFYVNTEAVPCHILSFSTAQKVLFVGKAVRVLLRSGRWLAVARAPIADSSLAHDDNIESSLDLSGVQQEIDELRLCFGAKSPAYILEHSVDRIRGSVALQLRQVVVVEAELSQHLAALKGFYLLGYGAFYQTFLEEASPLLQRPPSAHAESELQHGPWATAMSEHELAEDAISASRLEMLPLERLLANRFSVRFVPRSFEFISFADAARQLKLVGLARLAQGHAELGIGQPASSNNSSTVTVASAPNSTAMLWLSTRQRVAQTFDNRFTFQVHAPPYGRAGSTGEYGCRFALCFQNRRSPGELQRWKEFTGYGASGELIDKDTCLKSHVWTALDECLALEIKYTVLLPPPGTDVNDGQIAEVTFSVYVKHQGTADGTNAEAGAHGLGGSPVKLLASGMTAVPAPRGAMHMVRLMHDGSQKKLHVFFGLDAVAPICTAEFDFGASLSLDLGCAYLGFCLVPLDHQHQLVGDTRSSDGETVASASKRKRPEVRYGARDRPVSIGTWRHRVHSSWSLAASESLATDEAALGALDSGAWFDCTEVNYDVPWPLPLVITQSCLSQYNQLFKLLLEFRYALMELHKINLPRAERFPWVLRAQLSFFVSQVLSYLQQDVIEVAHQRMMQAIDASEDFDEVVGAHDEFLATVSANCFLTSPDMHDALLKVLRTASIFCRLKFTTTMRNAGDAASFAAIASARGAEMRRLQAEFVCTAEVVLRMMASMHKEGVHTHVSQLLLRLDYNGYFSGEIDDDYSVAAPND